MYAAIRQFKAKPGSADALAEKIKEAISIISDVSGFMGYYVVYAPDDTVTAISVFNTVAEAQESNRRALAFHRGQSRAPGHRAGHRDRRTSDRAFAALSAIPSLSPPAATMSGRESRKRPALRRSRRAPR